MTLNDTEGLLSTLVPKYLYLSSPRIFDWRSPHYHCQKCRHSDSINFIRIFTRVASRLKGASKDSTAVDNGNFQYCNSLVLRIFTGTDNSKLRPVNDVGKLITQNTRDSTAFLLLNVGTLADTYEQTFTWLKKSPVFGIQQSGSPKCKLVCSVHRCVCRVACLSLSLSFRLWIPQVRDPRLPCSLWWIIINEWTRWPLSCGAQTGTLSETHTVPA